MTVSGMNASGFTNLFSSLNNSGSGLFNMNFSDYSMIRSGTYTKLMRSYYGTNPVKNLKASDFKTTDKLNNKTSTATSKETNAALAKIESSAEKLTETSKALYSGNAKAFKKVNGTDGDGKKTYDYDKDAIYKAVSSFVGDYNATIKAAGKSDADGIARSAAAIATATNQNSSALKSLGITIDSDSQLLSIDKDTFMKADMEKAKSLFNGTGSYAYNVATKASMLDYQAQREAGKANTYGKNAQYNSNYSSGSIFNNYF